VAQAARLGVGVEIVHVFPSYVPVAPMLPPIPDDLQEVGRSILADAVRVATEADPTVAVTTTLSSGPSAREIIAAAADARMLVVGHESTPAWERVFTGAVTLEVAAHAGCPVVSVPEGWQPTEPRRRIVVGYEDVTHEAGLLSHAFTLAAARGADLTILHAWKLPGCYDDMIVRRTHEEEWHSAARERIESQIAGLREDDPEVEVDVRVVHDQPAHALREASRDADLLVVGRHADSGIRHLGSTVAAVLREAACPVEVVPTRLVGGVGELRLEEAGAPLK
jgi:nucleotide-binding universal stress UspA family protein